MIIYGYIDSVLEKERHRLILHQLELRSVISLQDLTRQLGASPATLRRDLDKLERDQLLKRVHGGAEAMASSPTSELSGLPLEYTIGLHVEKKMRIARRAVEMIAPGETVALDAGSTIYQMAEFLRGLSLGIITHSFAIARALGDHPNLRLFLPGGQLHAKLQVLLSPFEDDFYSHFRASKAFISAQGIDEQGVTNTDSLLIRAQKQMMRCAREIILLADSSKLGQRGNLLLCDLNDVHTLITDEGIDPSFRSHLEQRGLNILIA